jgi:hypothetical protein
MVGSEAERSPRGRAMQPFPFLIGTAGAAVAALSFLAVIQIQAPGAVSEVDSTPVNRALKGDRLVPVTPAPSSENPAGEPTLPSGCELRFSSVRNAYANEVAGRCLAEGSGRSAPRLAVVA